jgi:hypothetical protein
MNYYIPSKALSTKNPRIILNIKSKFFDTDYIGENETVVFDIEKNSETKNRSTPRCTDVLR